MNRSYYVLKNISILNVVLLALAAALFFKMAYPLIDTDVKTNIPRPKAAAIKKDENAASEKVQNILDNFIFDDNHFFRPFSITDLGANAPEVKTEPVKKQEEMAASNMPAALDYAVVVDRNLFHPERKKPVEKKDEPIVVRPDIVFYGSVITGEKRIAYIEDKKNPYSTPGRGKRQMALAEGTMISGYLLKEVHPEFIVLTRGQDKMVVNLRDEKDRKTAETTNTALRPVEAATKSQVSGAPGISAGQVSGPAPVLPPQATTRSRRPTYAPKQPLMSK